MRGWETFNRFAASAWVKPSFSMNFRSAVISSERIRRFRASAGEKPRSLGLVKAQAERLSLPAGANIEKASFAVSVEPEGGSPTGAPTGPVLYSGQLVKG